MILVSVCTAQTTEELEWVLKEQRNQVSGASQDNVTGCWILSSPWEPGELQMIFIWKCTKIIVTALENILTTLWNRHCWPNHCIGRKWLLLLANKMYFDTLVHYLLLFQKYIPLFGASYLIFVDTDMIMIHTLIQKEVVGSKDRNICLKIWALKVNNKDSIPIYKI